MIPLGLSSAEQSALTAKLLDTHSIHVTIQILDLDGNRLSDLSDRLLSGQVNIDTSGDVWRSCTLSLLDDRRTLAFDSDSPSDGAIYLDRMIRVIYSVKVGTVWRDIPIFTGPVTKMDRTDDVVNLEASGKETLAMGASWRTRTYRRGANRVQTIRDIMHDLTGETKFTFPESTARLPVDVSLAAETVPWTVARQIAKGLNMELFYDGRGVLRLRKLPHASVFDFRDGDGEAMLTTPQITYSTDNLQNVVLVQGTRPTEAHVAAPNSHPLSPWRLGRNGVPRYLLEVIVDPTIRTRTEALALAKSRLDTKLLEAVQVSFDSLPVPYLEEGDYVRVITELFSASFRIWQTTIPLVAGDVMPIGYTRNVSPNKKRIRA